MFVIVGVWDFDVGLGGGRQRLALKNKGKWADKRALFRRNGVYFQPNLLTTFTLFLGCYAAPTAGDARFEGAAIALVLAISSLARA